jgi:hypothetical protein
MAQIDDFVSDLDGLRLIRAFMRIDNAALRRRIVMLVQEIAGDDTRLHCSGRVLVLANDARPRLAIGTECSAEERRWLMEVGIKESPGFSLPGL